MSITEVHFQVDLAFLLNFTMDWLWFWAAGRLAGAKVKGWRVFLAAAIGAALNVWAYYPSGHWIDSPASRLLGTLLLFGIAYLPCRLFQGIWLSFTFILTGVTMAALPIVVTILQEGAGATRLSGLAEPPPLLVAFGTPVALVGARILWDAARARTRLKEGICRLRIRGVGKEVEVDGFLDTGNSLKDPLSALPVVVVETAVLTPLLSEALLVAIAAGGPAYLPWDLLNDLPQAAASLGRFTLVPYHSVGQAGSALVAFAPESLAIKPVGNHRWMEVKGLVAVTAERLDPAGAYHALLPPSLVD